MFSPQSARQSLFLVFECWCRLCMYCIFKTEVQRDFTSMLPCTEVIIFICYLRHCTSPSLLVCSFPSPLPRFPAPFATLLAVDSQDTNATATTLKSGTSLTLRLRFPSSMHSWIFCTSIVRSGLLRNIEKKIRFHLMAPSDEANKRREDERNNRSLLHLSPPSSPQPTPCHHPCYLLPYTYGHRFHDQVTSESSTFSLFTLPLPKKKKGPTIIPLHTQYYGKKFFVL
jgi:hypothetical protein